MQKYFIELVVVFLGVALAFSVENLRDDLSEQDRERQYLRGFRQDMVADAEMLRQQLDVRRAQADHARTVLEFYEGRPADTQVFFAAFYTAALAINTSPNRNTMDEVLNSGNLRLLRDGEFRRALLDLYVTYERIAHTEAHMARDFDEYLYDPTFTSIPINVMGPWDDNAENRAAMATLLDLLPVRNGLHLIIVNLTFDGGVIPELLLAQSQVASLLEMLPEE